MELHTGICGLCNSESEVVNNEDARVLWEKIALMFGNQFENLSELKLDLKICSTCIFQVTFINTKKDMLMKNVSVDDESTLVRSCILCACTDSSFIFKVDNPKALEMFNPGLKLMEKDSLYVCAVCFYVVEANSNLRENLINKVSELKDSELDSPNRTKSRRYSPRKKNGDSNYQSKLEKENTTSTSKPFRKKSILEVSAPDSRESETASPTDTEDKPNKSLYKGHEESESSNNNLRSRNDSGNLSQKRKASMSPEDELSSKKRKRNTDQIHNVNGFNMSEILKFEPLCNTRVQINKKIKEDIKFFKSIPFVQLTVLKENELKRTSEDSISRRISRDIQESNLMRRTPPIKIRLKPEKKIIKHKKFNSAKKENEKGPKKAKSPALIEEIEKRKVVVKVARIVLPIKIEEDDSSSIEMHRSELKQNNINDNSPTKVRSSNLKDWSKEITTPKKKKRVHFNDTPTIIVPEEDNSEDLYPQSRDDKEEGATTNGTVLEDDEDVEEVIEKECDDKSNIVSVASGTINIDDEEDAEREETEKEHMEIDSDSSVEEIKGNDHSVSKSEEVKQKCSDSNDEISISDEDETCLASDDTQSSAQLRKKDNEEIIELDDKENSSNEEEKCDIPQDHKKEVINAKQVEEKAIDDERSDIISDLEVIDDSDDEGTDKKITSKKTNSSEKEELEEETSSKSNVRASDEDTVDLSDKKKDSQSNTIGEGAVVTEELIDTEDFGSLIDEVQKCLTSSNDLPQNSDEESVLELHISNEEENETTVEPEKKKVNKEKTPMTEDNGISDVQKDKSAAKEHNVSDEKEDISVKGDNVSTKEDNDSTREDNASTSEDNASAKGDTASAKEDNASAKEDSAAAIGDNNDSGKAENKISTPKKNLKRVSEESSPDNLTKVK